jgi:hypothetical protein
MTDLKKKIESINTRFYQVTAKLKNSDAGASEAAQILLDKYKIDVSKYGTDDLKKLLIKEKTLLQKTEEQLVKKANSLNDRINI